MAAKKTAAKAKKTVTKKAIAKKAIAKKKPAAKKPVAKKPLMSALPPRAPGEVRYWLVKTEPDVFSFDDLVKQKRTFWDGVRNYQARNYLRDEMKPGDLVLVYHSNAEPPGAAGVAKIVREGYPDHTQFEPDHVHFDPDAKRESPTWFMVDIEAVEKFPREVPLPALRDAPGLEKMMLLQKGSRLSVQPVKQAEFEIVCRLGGLSR